MKRNADIWAKPPAWKASGKHVGEHAFEPADAASIAIVVITTAAMERERTEPFGFPRTAQQVAAQSDEEPEEERRGRKAQPRGQQQDVPVRVDQRRDGPDRSPAAQADRDERRGAISTAT